MNFKEAFTLLVILLTIVSIYIVLNIIGRWKVFKKAGLAGWKSLIPFYSTYKLYEITWHKSLYWLFLTLVLVNGFLSNLGESTVILSVSSIITLALLVLNVEQTYKMAKCFNKGTLFTLGLIFFNPIFIIILGFDASTYKYVESENKLLIELKGNLVNQSDKYKTYVEKEVDHGKKFAQGFCFTKVFIFFVIGCLIGTYWEEGLNFVKTFTYSDRQGLLYGPFSPIYGIGICIFVLCLGKNNDKHTILKTYLYSCLIGGGVEYLTSFIAEKLFNVHFWDYHGMFLNIDGRTTVPFMLVWGLGGLIIMKIGYPIISRWLEMIPAKPANIVFKIFVFFFTIDVILTYSAFGRMTMRNNGQKPMTFYGEFLDEHYSNEYMAKKFPVMNIPK